MNNGTLILKDLHKYEVPEDLQAKTYFDFSTHYSNKQILYMGQFLVYINIQLSGWLRKLQINV